jgi:pyruvate formate lyase activating enzyme
VGFDAKASFAGYAHLTGVAGSGQRAEESLACLLASGVAHETRTTVHPALLSDAELSDMARDLAARGVKHYVVQAFRSQGCRNEGLRENAARNQPLQEVGRELAGLFEEFAIRA